LALWTPEWHLTGNIIKGNSNFNDVSQFERQSSGDGIADLISGSSCSAKYGKTLTTNSINKVYVSRFDGGSGNTISSA
jgi:hypothetical protein